MASSGSDNGALMMKAVEFAVEHADKIPTWITWVRALYEYAFVFLPLLTALVWCVVSFGRAANCGQCCNVSCFLVAVGLLTFFTLFLVALFPG